MTRVALSQLPGDRVLVVDEHGDHVVAAADVPKLVATREADAPRWVWDDTARWYPPLLEAGVRVRRCHDLRLAQRVLLRAPAVDRSALDGEEAPAWDRLRPGGASEPALFLAHESTEYLRAELEDERQLAAVVGSTESGRLALLLAAESSGALAAAEMTHTGMPWRAEVHEHLLTDLLGPRPASARRSWRRWRSGCAPPWTPQGSTSTPAHTC